MKNKEYNKELENKNLKDLFKILNKEYNSLHKYCFDTKFRNIKDVTLIKKTKKNIARIYTEMNKKIKTQGK